MNDTNIKIKIEEEDHTINNEIDVQNVTNFVFIKVEQNDNDNSSSSFDNHKLNVNDLKIKLEGTGHKDDIITDQQKEEIKDYASCFRKDINNQIDQQSLSIKNDEDQNSHIFVKRGKILSN